MEQTKELDLTNPVQIKEFAPELRQFITDSKLAINIKGKEYVTEAGWKFAGIQFGIIAIVNKPIKCDGDGEIKYSCEADLIRVNTGQKVGYGFAICSNKEALKRSFDEYAICSMAQTRAISKAYRNCLSFIMSTAGFEGTPAEEMKYEEKKTLNLMLIIDQINLMNDRSELEAYWRQLPIEAKANEEVIESFKIKSLKFKNHG